MHEIIRFFVIFIWIGFVKSLCSQDTIHLQPKVSYNTKSDTIDVLSSFSQKGNVYRKAKYAKELIRFGNDSAVLESCFYYDEKRFCDTYKRFGFKTQDDSIIKVYFSTYVEEWVYTKQNDSLFSLRRNYGTVKEYGQAKSLFPLEKYGDFFAINDKGDTLWSSRYSNIIFPKINIWEKPISDTVYGFCEIMPVYEGGNHQLVKDIAFHLFFDGPALDSQIKCTHYISYVVNKDGEMCNIQFERTSGSGFQERSILIALSKLKSFKPGYHEGKVVNARMILPIRIDLDF